MRSKGTTPFHPTLHVTGQKRCQPHLAIPGVTPTPQRFHCDNAKGRGSLQLAVAVNSVGGVFIKETTGTSYPGYAAAWIYQTEDSKKKGVWKPATRMTGEEYLSFVEEALAFFQQQPGFPSKVSRAMLVHDKSKQHCSKTAVEGLQKLGLAVMARSPDVMPLDYGFFRLHQEAAGQGCPSACRMGRKSGEVQGTTAGVLTCQHHC